MAKVFVTGAEGFTGRYLVDALKHRGDRVYAMVRQPSQIQSDIDGTFVADLNDHERISSIIEEVAPDKVVHLAAIASVQHGNVEELYRTNILGTRNLLSALSRTKSSKPMVLVASSANIYGNATAEGPIDEGAPVAPENDYAVSKVAVEYVARLFSNDLPIVISRPFNYTGVGQSTRYLVPKIVEHVKKRAGVLELGNIDISRDFSDVRFVVDCYCKLLEAPAAVGHTVNICSGFPKSLRSILDLVKDETAYNFEIRVNPAFVRRNEVKHLYGDKSKLERIIGPLDVPDFRDTIRWMLSGK